MKIALVYIPANQSMPLGLAYLSSVLKREDFKVCFFNLVNFNDKTCLDDVYKFGPDVVGYSVITGTQKLYLNFNEKLKKRLKNITSVVGGPHPTFSPEIIHEKGVDAVCIGESENAFLHFMKKFRAKGTLPKRAPNFWIKYNGEISKSSLLPLITDLDSIPYPDREGYFKVDKFVGEFARRSFIASRGCPYKCTYCFNESFNKLYSNKNILRFRSPESVCDEIIYVSSMFTTKSVYFVDDVFTINKDWIMKLCEQYRRKVKLPFMCNIRLNNTDDEIIKSLKEAGCAVAIIGAESGSEFIRNEVMKRKMSIDLMLERVKIFHKYKIKLFTENIIGNPRETYEMALETLRLNQKINPQFANASLFTPYPKLAATNFAIENKLFDANPELISSNYFSDSLLKFKNGEGEKNRLLNLRCFFSFLVKFQRYEKIVISLFINIKHNNVFRFFGKVVDGYYAFKCLPHKLTFAEIFKMLKQYLFMPR
jgi:radical SAM superfamily enzyme YgiQ (UPF0313 family)|tara:strand:+ start:1159 stop:2601 length:1443 start_codon:yes stop_codon:yes gene_type:complete